MKKHILCTLCIVSALCAQAQTLNVVVGDVTYQFPAVQAGDMIYEDGELLTVQGHIFELSDITKMYVDNTSVTDNTVAVSYNGTSASVCVAGNIAQYIDASVSGAHVDVTQSTTLSDTNGGEITYMLSGTSDDGEFYLSGSYKASIELYGLTLTNQNPVKSGAAIHIQNGKRIELSVKEGTVNTLTDAASGEQKACLYVKGHLELKGHGTLNVYGKLKHGIKSGEYCTVKNCTVNVLSAVGDGISCNEYFALESGTVNISGTDDDGLQCDLDGTVNTGETTDHEDEDSGNIYITDGTLNITTTALAAKGIKGEGDINVNGGTITVTTSGDGTWDTDDLETKASCGMSCDGNMTISGGTLTLTSTGSGGKGAKCDGVFTMTDGSLTINTSGGLYYNNGTTENTNYTSDTDGIDSDYYSSPKGIKAGVKTETTTGGRTTYTYSGDLVISGGTIDVTTTGHNGEGIESKNTLTISGGDVTVNSYDDGINSAQEMYLSGGNVTVVASGNDAIDSNANMHISAGTVIACGAGGAECGLDAAEGYSLYITGGNVLAIGANNNAVSSTTGSQCVLSTTASVTGGSTVSVKSSNGSTTYVSFTIPSNYTFSNGGNGGGPMHVKAMAPGGGGPDGGGGGPDGGGGGPDGGGGEGGETGGSASLLISCAGLSSGTSYTVTSGSVSVNATAATTTSDGMR